MSPWSSAGLLLTFLTIVFIANCIARYKRNIRLIRDYPGYRYMGPGGRLSDGIPPSIIKRGLEAGTMWDSKHEGLRSIWLGGHFGYDDRLSEQVPKAAPSKLDIYGINILSTEGSLWARHRRISSPAFSESMNQLAWKQTIRVVNDMFDTDWYTHGDQVSLGRVEEPLKEITILVIMAAAFGYIDDWIPTKSLASGHTMTFRDSLQLVLHNWLLLVSIPRFFWDSTQNQNGMNPGALVSSGWFGKRMQETAVSYAELGSYMREMVHNYQLGSVEIKREQRDVFSVLTAAIESEKENTRMTMDEVFGNMFIFLLAGHETTAHTLAYVFGLLALDEDEQDRLFEHIKDIIAERELILTQNSFWLFPQEYTDCAKLNRVVGVIYEAMRLFPPVVSFPKYSTEDAYFMVDPALSEEELTDPTVSEERRTRKKEVFIPKGSEIGINTSALHYNHRSSETRVLPSMVESLTHFKLVRRTYSEILARPLSIQSGAIYEERLAQGGFPRIFDRTKAVSGTEIRGGGERGHDHVDLEEVQDICGYRQVPRGSGRIEDGEAV
ncbi:hypothetical protein FRB97_002691 [Tulasnella sp. 331]|nr:hypothetical protein FRB97_002691 [Tulasnella sp. 331]